MKRITIPENTRVIIDGDVVIFESKNPIYEIGKWYSDGLCVCLKISNGERGKSNAVGFVGCGWNDDMVIISNNWQPADMKEVTRLLIGEAENRGTKKGSNFIDRDGIEKTILSNPWLENNRLLVEIPSGIGILFDFKTGKWAEMIEEKKPLYTNAFGTEFFEGDRVYYVVQKRLNILNCSIENMPEKQRAGLHGYSEIMTERECHQYIADNWDKLKK